MDIQLGIKKHLICFSANEICKLLHYTQCLTCNGNKMIRCTFCGGGRTIVCPHCHGINPNCVKCGGKGYFDCERCKATGQITCTVCNGEGHNRCMTCTRKAT